MVNSANNSKHKNSSDFHFNVDADELNNYRYYAHDILKSAS